MDNMALLPQGEIYPLYGCITETLFGHGKLKFVKDLGSGMSSQVVLATSPTPPFAAQAVKIISLSNNANFMKKLFYNEVSAMQIFNHRHLMKATCAYEHPTHLFICMDYSPLGSLGDFITNLSFALVEKYLVQLASAVKHMHDNGFAHCDIKLGNILLHTSDHVILADFGLCFKMPENVDEIPAGYVGGTIVYAAPERRHGDPNGMVNPMKMDMYALGLVLKAMIYGYDPENPDQTDARPRTENDVPEILLFCLENLLNENYRERFSSSQLLETLLAWSRLGALARLLKSQLNSGSQRCAQTPGKLHSGNMQL